VILTKAVPWLNNKAYPMVVFHNKKGVEREAPVYPKWFVLWAWITVISLVVILWGLFLTLVFSSGWKNPFAPVSEWGLGPYPGWFWDFVFARANDLPNGAHIFSWLSCAAFGLAVWGKTLRRPFKHFRDVLGDPYQGIAALVFIGGVHELTWVPFYYAAYYQYLSWSIILEVLRDVSFAVMMGLFILAFWKYKGRVVPLQIVKPYWLIYIGFLVAWFVVPKLFGYPFFPVTTLNNTNFGIGIYLETPYFPWWWVNAIEEFGWILLCWPSIVKVLLYKGAKVPY
jgi:hypothetical protein